MEQDYQDVLPEITSLLYSVQQTWKILENVTKKLTPEDGHLRRYLEGFLEYDYIKNVFIH